MSEESNLVARLLENDFDLQAPKAITLELAAARARALGSFLGLPPMADAELSGYFDMQDKR